jgi:hypothetical protein
VVTGATLTGPTLTAGRTFSHRPGVGQKSRAGRILAAVRQCSRNTTATPAIVSAGGRHNRRNRSEVLTDFSFRFLCAFTRLERLSCAEVP